MARPEEEGGGGGKRAEWIAGTGGKNVAWIWWKRPEEWPEVVLDWVCGSFLGVPINISDSLGRLKEQVRRMRCLLFMS